MTTDWVVRFIVAAAVCMAITTALSTSANANSCCLCSGCESGSPTCFNDSSCGEACNSFCSSAGCTAGTFDPRVCNDVPTCRQITAASAGSGPLYLALTLMLATFGVFALRRRSLPASIRVAAAVLVLLSTAIGLRALTEFHLNGQWQFDATALQGSGPSTPQEHWSADLALNDDGAVSGTVTGFSGIDVAKVEGTVHDGAVAGTLRDGDGPVAAEFQGTIANGSLRGTFTKLESGETGTFSCVP